MELPLSENVGNNLINPGRIHDTEFYVFDELKYHFYTFIKNVKELSHIEHIDNECINNGWFILDITKKVNDKIKKLENEIIEMNKELETRIVSDKPPPPPLSPPPLSPIPPLSSLTPPLTPLIPQPPINTASWRRRGGGVPGRLIGLSEDPVTNRVLNELLPLLISFNMFGGGETNREP